MKSEKILVSVGYDAYQIENFLFIPKNLKSLKKAERKRMLGLLHQSIKFNSEIRKRDWQIIFFGW